jgi:hypothetical protein
MRTGRPHFWAKNAHWEYDWWELTLDIERKMRVGSLEKCLKVGKLTKIYSKLTKVGAQCLKKCAQSWKKWGKVGRF